MWRGAGWFSNTNSRPAVSRALGTHETPRLAGGAAFQFPATQRGNYRSAAVSAAHGESSSARQIPLDRFGSTRTPKRDFAHPPSATFRSLEGPPVGDLLSPQTVPTLKRRKRRAPARLFARLFRCDFEIPVQRPVDFPRTVRSPNLLPFGRCKPPRRRRSGGRILGCD